MNRRCLNCMNVFMVPEGYEDDDNCCPFCGFIENTSPRNVSYLRPGIVLKERYSIGTVIGAGGFGITYKAWDNTLDNIVAIKEFFPHGIVHRDNKNSKTGTVSVYNIDDDSYEHGKERFLKEAKSLAKFNSHPGTAAIYDYFEENETAYIVMEYLDGCNMKEYVAAAGRLPTLDMLVKMTESVCDILSEVHAVGLIHRDISPDNIFMCKNGTFKLIDFGSVKQGINNNNLSATVILKHGYAPIEQYTKAGNIGPWTDIYSLGATIYKLATGIIPQESVERISEDGVVDICELNDGIPRGFGDAVMKALSPQAKDRYQTIEDLKKDIFENTHKNDETTKKDKNDFNEIVIDVPKPIEGTNDINKTQKGYRWKKQAIIKIISLSLLTIVLLSLLIISFVFSKPEEELKSKERETETTIETTTETTTETTIETTTEISTMATTEETTEASTGSRSPNLKQKDTIHRYSSTGYETVVFGNYWQEDTNGDEVVDKNDEKQPIVWRVLEEKDDGTALVVSDEVLDCQKYNTNKNSYDSVISDINDWCNDFYNTAFSDEEREEIIKNGNDFIFILSQDDITNNRYGFDQNKWNNDSNRVAYATSFAHDNGLELMAENIDDYCIGKWWIISDMEGYLGIVDDIGVIDPCIAAGEYGMRPAMYINISS